jgi:hypothetical protein
MQRTVKTAKVEHLFDHCCVRGWWPTPGALGGFKLLGHNVLRHAVQWHNDIN